MAAPLALAIAAIATAHAVLTMSDPADGATIATPHTLTATFSEPFDADPQRSFIHVENAAGAVVAQGAQSPTDDTKMTADISTLGTGEYTVRWQTTTSDDGAVERGTFKFTVAAVATPSPAATPGTPAGGDSGGSDVTLALAIAAIVLLALGVFLSTRRRR